ncbi:hypothetical protein JD292_02470 [Leucobacter sp. CSA2]|uniref:Uncharacterized protein n=1 Tax=Leucobacter edaphi TaxID=2796472 RepID=A0A934QBZ4_9MICO|nr:hypothetical protein [Leucobacter edaphi]MBK0420946.1 hypothetical protein [Leucobacter edaphi]
MSHPLDHHENTKPIRGTTAKWTRIALQSALIVGGAAIGYWTNGPIASVSLALAGLAASAMMSRGPKHSVTADTA